MADQEQWWETIKVSSNGQLVFRLTDGDPTSYWESYSKSNPVHWINIKMKKGVVVR